MAADPKTLEKPKTLNDHLTALRTSSDVAYNGAIRLTEAKRDALVRAYVQKRTLEGFPNAEKEADVKAEINRKLEAANSARQALHTLLGEYGALCHRAANIPAVISDRDAKGKELGPAIDRYHEALKDYSRCSVLNLLPPLSTTLATDEKAQQEKIQAMNNALGAFEQFARQLQRGNTVLQQETKALQQKNEALQQKNEALQQGNEALQQENEALRQENGALQQKNESLQQKNESLQQENEALRQENEALWQENEALQQGNESLVYMVTILATQFALAKPEDALTIFTNFSIPSKYTQEALILASRMNEMRSESSTASHSPAHFQPPPKGAAQQQEKVNKGPAAGPSGSP